MHTRSSKRCKYGAPDSSEIFHKNGPHYCLVFITKTRSFKIKQNLKKKQTSRDSLCASPQLCFSVKNRQDSPPSAAASTAPRRAAQPQRGLRAAASPASARRVEGSRRPDATVRRLLGKEPAQQPERGRGRSGRHRCRLDPERSLGGKDQDRFQTAGPRAATAQVPQPGASMAPREDFRFTFTHPGAFPVSGP